MVRARRCAWTAFVWVLDLEILAVQCVGEGEAKAFIGGNNDELVLQLLLGTVHCNTLLPACSLDTA